MDQVANQSMEILDLKQFMSPVNMEVAMNQRIETDILYPTSFSQSSTRFVFDRKGILDSNSILRLKLLVAEQAGPVQSNSFLPISTGVSSLVSRAWLEIGGRRVSSLEGNGHFQTFSNLAHSSDYKEQILKAREGYLGNVNPADSTNATVIGKIGKAPDQDSFFSDSYKLRSDSSSPEFAIPISKLIPMLRGFQLPLFAIEQQVTLNIEWQRQNLNGRYCLRAGEAEVASTIDQESCVLACDYLFYPDQMQNIADQIGATGGYIHNYDEVQMIESNEPASNVNPGAGLHAVNVKYSHQIALAGRLLKSLVIQSYKNPSALQGIYTSSADQIEGSYNVLIESRPYYSNDVQNPSFKHREVGGVMSHALNLNDWEYSFSNQTTPVVGNSGGEFAIALSGFSDYTVEGISQQIRSGAQQWTGLSLSDINFGVQGVLLSNLPITLNRTRSVNSNNLYPTAVTDYNTNCLVRIFAITARALIIRNGQATIVQ